LQACKKENVAMSIMYFTMTQDNSFFLQANVKHIAQDFLFLCSAKLLSKTSLYSLQTKRSIQLITAKDTKYSL
jgi:hypothetical protein